MDLGGLTTVDCKSISLMIVDDIPINSKLLAKLLEPAGFGSIVQFNNSRQALDCIGTVNPDILLLDVMMPVVDGFTFLEKVREDRSLDHIKVVMVSAVSESEEIQKAINMGADDYVTKPFNPIEVMARVKSQLRRFLQLGGGSVTASVLRIGGIELDDDAKTVRLDGEAVNLTPKEYDILRFLMQNPGKVFSPSEIYRRVWDDLPLNADNALAVHIRHIREKIEYNPAEPRYLKVVWGKGYKMEADPR